MKVALIVPTAHLDEIPNTGYHMCLPQQVLVDPKYAEYYATRRGYKILDNGAAEGLPATFEEIIQSAEIVDADEIVMPDFMGHCDNTLEMSKTFATWVRTERPDAIGRFKFGAVLQGKSFDEVLKCYNGFAFWPEFQGMIDVCYIPRILANNIQRAIRINFMEAIQQGNLDRHFNEFHALGATRHMKEVVTLCDTDIRGIDTSQPAVLAHHGISLRDDATARARKDGFFEAVLDKDLLLDNIKLYLEWAS